MARVKRSVHSKKRRRVVMERAKGHYGNRSRVWKAANESVMHAGNYAFRDRRVRKRDFRRLWITRINAACRQRDMRYSQLIHGLAKAKVELNRKMLSEMAIHDPAGFDAVVEIARKALDG